MSGAYYNEFDPFAAAWLRELIKAGLIADGDVDERSITEVRSTDLAKYTQCHFFAGIGGWSRALRLAKWDDSRFVWTGSCPCQPFSAAGSQDGADDPRHLWPAWARLIRECRPDVIFGEQVEAAVAHGWLDLVCDDLEREGYAVGAAALPACSVGAPHIRQRVWFVAESQSEQQHRGGNTGRGWRESSDGSSLGHPDQQGSQGQHDDPERVGERSAGAASVADGVAHTEKSGTGADLGELWGVPDGGGTSSELADPTSPRRDDGRNRSAEEGIVSIKPEQRCTPSFVADALSAGWPERGTRTGSGSSTGGSGGDSRVADPDGGEPSDSGLQRSGGHDEREKDETPSFWSTGIWIPCRDGKYRIIEPGSSPLATGVPKRVGRLRGYGNAIVPQVAAEFIKAYVATREASEADRTVGEATGAREQEVERPVTPQMEMF